MPQIEGFHLRPLGWETDPEEERYKVSTLDYLSPAAYDSYALYFKVDGSEKGTVISVLKQGLERTLSQARYLCCSIEKDADGHHSFVKNRDSTVKFVIQHMDSAEDNLISFDELEESHFLIRKLGDISLFSNYPMTYGEKPEAHPDNSPKVSSYKATFIRGGLILNTMVHHYANDVSGWGSFAKQLAENCFAIANNTAFPPWDPACLDRRRFTIPAVPVESRVAAPPQPPTHPDHPPTQALLFHLPNSRAAELKKAAWPSDGTWISTYDAITAISWRVFTRIRAPLYKPDPKSKPFWGEAVAMTKRLSHPPPPERLQGNIFVPVVSPLTPQILQPTVEEVISTAPLWQLARYSRKMTDSATEEWLMAALRRVAPVKNKADLSVKVSSFPPMSMVYTDWRPATVCEYDFGFGKPRAYRGHWDTAEENVFIVLPPRNGPAGEDEGVEVQVSFEKELVEQLVADEEFGRYFEFRGVDIEVVRGG